MDLTGRDTAGLLRLRPTVQQSLPPLPVPFPSTHSSAVLAHGISVGPKTSSVSLVQTSLCWKPPRRTQDTLDRRRQQSNTMCSEPLCSTRSLAVPRQNHPFRLTREGTAACPFSTVFWVR